MKRFLSALFNRLTGPAPVKGSDVDRMIAVSKQVPSDPQTVRKLGGGIFNSEWRVGLGCCRALANAEAALPLAVEYLVSGLSHPKSSVRNGAAQALRALAGKVPVPSETLWEHLLTESDALGARELAAALAASSPGNLTETTTLEILATLEEWFERGGKIPIQGTQTEEIFEVRADGYLYDVYGIACGLLDTLITAPGHEEQRFRFFLKYLQAEFGSQSYANFRVKGLVALSSTEERKKALLEKASSGDRKAQGHPNLQLLRLQPDWVAEILRRHLTAELSIDQTNWKHFLGKMTSEQLRPLENIFQNLPDAKKITLMKLLSEAPLDGWLKGLECCLHSTDKEVVTLGLKRLVKSQQALPYLVPTLIKLKEGESDESIQDLCDQVIGQSGGIPGASSETDCQGTEPTLQLEILLEQTYRTPFGPEQKAWQESLVRCSAHYTPGQIVVRTPTGLHCFEIRGSQAEGPVEVNFPESSLRSNSPPYVAMVGESGDIFLSDGGANQTQYYLLRDQKLVVLKPKVPSDHTPRQAELRFNGKEYGWSKTAWIMSPFEHDPGHHEDVAYTISPSKRRIRSGLSGGNWRSVEALHLRASFGRSVLDKPSPQFRYLPQGGFRRLDSLGLIVSSEGENPIDSAVCSKGPATLLADVFADRRLRISLWLSND